MNNKLKQNLLLTIILVYAYYFFEWLFFVTKPSFLVKLTPLECLSVLFVTPLPASVVCTGLVLGVNFVSGSVVKNKLAPLVPASILSLIVFILIDNFTHTVFGFYVGSHTGYSRYGYSALLFLLFIFSYLKMTALLLSSSWERYIKLTTVGVVSLPLISIMFIIVHLTDIDFEKENIPKLHFKQRPNIVIFSTDGLVADHMSVSGYSRKTTPFIETLADDSLFAENSFTNSSATMGSIGALISGKLPAKTGVMFPPSIFYGLDIYEHFVGLLKRGGYRTIEVGTPRYADSYDLNIRGAFDVSTMREHDLDNDIFSLPTSVRRLFVSESYFLELVNDRIKSRVLHSLFLVNMTDAFKMVTETTYGGLTDEQRLKKLFSFIGEGNGDPFFAHLHLMETHGPRFDLSSRHYSVGESQNNDFQTNFYDDAVLNYDFKVKELVSYLKLKNLYEDTILILTTDHGTRWSTNMRLPLLIRFPDGQHKGRVSINTQRADIPPTILDFLGTDIPSWMNGDSLISTKFEKNRLIITATNARNHIDENGVWQIVDFSPPFYAIGKIAVIQCQQLTELNLKTKKVQKMIINDHTQPCDSDSLMSEDQAYEFMINYMEGESYDMAGFTEYLNAGFSNSVD